MALILIDNGPVIKHRDGRYQKLSSPYIYSRLEYNSSDKTITTKSLFNIEVFVCDEEKSKVIHLHTPYLDTMSLWSNRWFTLHIYSVCEEGFSVSYIEAISHETKLSDRKKINMNFCDCDILNKTQVFESENVDYHVGFTTRNKLYKIWFTETPNIGHATLRYEVVELTNINDFKNHSLLYDTNIEFNGMYMSMYNCDANKIQKHFSLKCVIYDYKLALLTEEGPIILDDDEQPYFEKVNIPIPKLIRTKPARK